MKLDLLLNKTVLVKQLRSSSKLDSRQKGTLFGLGLKRIGCSSKVNCSQEVIGMIKKVYHLVSVSSL